MSRKMLAAALWYAQNGWYVFPLTPGAKEPLIPASAGGRGLLDATTDDAQIRRWWKNRPDANIGIACEPSGLVVVDVDTKNGGDATYEDLRSDLGSSVFDTVVAHTPSGGQHVVFATDGERVSSGAHVLGQGIDIRAAGGYIVVAPSVVNGKEYVWEVESGPRDRKPAMWPDEIGSRIVKRTVAAPLEQSGKIPSGERNATLASIAGSLRRRGLDFDEMLGALQVVNYKRCEPPLPSVDIERICQSIARYAPDEVIGALPEHKPSEIVAVKAIEVFSEIHDRYDESGPAMSFGIRKLDEKIGGMRRGQVSVLAARTGVGKTAFAEHIIEIVARTDDVLMFSLEMSPARIIERIAARHEGMMLKEYRNAGRPMADTSWMRALRLSFVSNRQRLSIEAIEEKIAENPPALTVIDHTRRISGWLPTSGKMRADLSPAHVMQSITRMAEVYNTHILLLSQCSRSADGSRPKLSDLRDSGSVEEEADNVIFLHRPFEFGDPDGGEDDVVEICTWKSRESDKFVTHCKWHGPYMQFVDFDSSQFNLQYQRCCSGENKSRRRAS